MEAIPASPKPQEAANPVTDNAIAIAAGTKIGLNMITSGVMATKLITVKVKVRPARLRRIPLKGTSATTGADGGGGVVVQPCFERCKKRLSVNKHDDKVVYSKQRIE